MSTHEHSSPQRHRPDVSFIMPCYNEEQMVAFTIPRLVSAFEKGGYRLELVAVDNGSNDQTGNIIKSFAERFPNVVYHRVDVNEGYGNGVLRSISVCTAPWIGIIPADGQVDAEDVVRLYEAAVVTCGNIVAKARRRFRMDGLLRKLVSAVYNMFVFVVWPGLGTNDLNGTPKLMRREVIDAMQLESKGWFLDPEIMIKARFLRLRIIDFNMFAHMRGSGLAHVAFRTSWELAKNLITYRFSRSLAQWKKDRAGVSISILPTNTADLCSAVNAGTSPFPNRFTENLSENAVEHLQGY